ncbi:MAG TPA: tail fiber protein [Acidimicrobiales bacterium]|nr:tail fiber protein [Acidimicrobiales bacterium]
MSNPYLGEIRVVSFTFAPHGWAMCNGQLLPINQNQALFSLLGTTYGGDGISSFALPNLEGRVPVHIGSNFTQGQAGGEATHVLTTAEIPGHTHGVAVAAGTGTAVSPAGNYWAGIKNANPFSTASPSTTLAPTAIGNSGLGQGHDNMPPGLVLNYIMAMAGIFPSRN